jgi:hypothetical protein
MRPRLLAEACFDPEFEGALLSMHVKVLKRRFEGILESVNVL